MDSCESESEAVLGCSRQPRRALLPPFFSTLPPMSLQSVGYLGLGSGAVWLVKRIHHVYFTLTDIPTVGPSGFFGTYLAVKKYILTPEEFLAEGYRKFPNTVFKLYTQDGWTLVASGDDRLADMRKAGDDVLSFLDNVNDITQLEFTMGKEIARDMYHANVVKTTLTRNIAAKFDDGIRFQIQNSLGLTFPSVRDEINEATKDNIPPSEDWTPVSVLPTMMRIISRGANRMFLGLDFCRNEEFLQVNIDYTIGVITGAVLLRIFPEFARPILAKLFCKTEAHYRIARKHLEPMLRYRLEQEEKYGPDWEGKPNDYISWLLLIATGEQRTVRDLVFRVLGLNFAAIHTTSH
ncbi:cytochrome P450 [Flagelloscypha sp. PMI_526]|nr:cytochrome P450 [Flagelloscypha sp. PMI_526]